MRTWALALVLAGCAPTLVWTGRSPDRRSVVTVDRDDARLRVTTDGGSPRLYDTIAFERLTWSSRGVLAPAERDAAWWMIDGANERGPFVSIGEVVTAGTHTAYVAQESDGFRVVVDGERGAPFDAIAEGLVLDGEHGSVAYVVQRGDGEHAVHDIRVGPACELVAMLTLGAKGRSLAYVDRGTRDRLLVDDAEIATFDRVLELVIADAEPRWAAIVGEGDDSVLVHDGASLARGTFLTHLRLSNDGAHVACLSSDPDGTAIDVILDGAHVARHRRIDGERLAFVPDDDRLVIVAEDSQGLRVTLGDATSERYEALEGPVLASRRVGWIGRRAEHSEVVVEGTIVATEEWAGTLALAAQGDGYAYVARADGQRFVVTSRGRWPVPRLFVDTLVLDDEGRHWAALVPDASAHALEIWIDGTAHGALDDHELGGAVVIEDDRTMREVVRAVVAAELAHAVE